MTVETKIEPGLRKLAWVLLAGAVALYILLSAPALLRIGIPYDAPYGPPFAKFHPGTYCLLLAWFVALASHGNPLQVMGAQLARHRLLAAYFISMVLVFVWAVFRHGTSGAAFIVETLWMPAIAAFTLYLLDVIRHRQIVQGVMLLLACNSVLAIVESLSQTRLTPLNIGRDDIIAEAYFRSSAFFGHPLNNALITVSLLPAITLLPWSLFSRVTLALTLMLSVLAFGGRASLVLGLLIYGGYAGCRVFFDVVRRRFSYLQLTGGSLAFMLGATMLAGVVAATGLGERIFKNLQWDSSAGVRLRVWDAFAYISNADLWMGMAPAQIDHISVRLGLDPRYEAIENFWIYLFLQLGVIGFAPFVAGLLCLVVTMWRVTTPTMRAAIVLYFVSASTGNTLASKTISLLLLVLVMLAGASFGPEEVRAVSGRRNLKFAPGMAGTGSNR